ncbi:MAG: hypothetical protein U0T11_04970 [Chitinophagaceae bacterium]
MWKIIGIIALVIILWLGISKLIDKCMDGTPCTDFNKLYDSTML